MLNKPQTSGNKQTTARKRQRYFGPFILPKAQLMICSCERPSGEEDGEEEMLGE